MAEKEGRRERWTHQTSAGGVVLRTDGDQPEVLAVRPVGHERWQLPKGLVDRGESPRQAAVREVREEGGVSAEIVAELDPFSYFFRAGSSRIRKTVHFYAMRFVAGDPADHDHEIAEARWIPATDIAQLAFPSERRVAEQALQHLGQGRNGGARPPGRDRFYYDRSE